MSDSTHSMKVLVIGSGGREHSLCWKIGKSPMVSEVICAPGNAGIGDVARIVAVAANDLDGLMALAEAERPGLVVIGPEDPLAAGLADRMRDAGFRVFGPGAEGAQLEASKAFSKDLIERHRIPTATARSFDRSGQAKGYLEGCTTWPQVVKADGLAAGKGVYICQDLAEAKVAVDGIMEEGRHGEAGAQILIEEFLVGEEASVFAITDGDAVLVLEPVQDHKQAYDGDEGPNTGGMGVYSPVPELSKRIYKQIEQHVLLPSIHMLRREKIPFRGVLFIGLMLTEGGPRVIEYNVRFGDPETQVVLPRLTSSLVDLLWASATGSAATGDGVASVQVTFDDAAAVTVVMASAGYPESSSRGDVIGGVADADALEGVQVLHAGTALDAERRLVTAGGRVLAVTALGRDLEQARERAYGGVACIRFDGAQHRSDIGSAIDR